MAPNHPKALWYGSMAALQAGDLRQGRDRLQLLMAQNPPEELRGVLERQIQDLNQQLGEARAGCARCRSEAPKPGGCTSGQRSIRVSVTIAPQVREQLQAARCRCSCWRAIPQRAVRRWLCSATARADLPLTVELSERDAMIPTRTIATVPKVQVVARLSRSGTPQAQSGDFFGEAEYEFGKDDSGHIEYHHRPHRTVASRPPDAIPDQDLLRRPALDGVRRTPGYCSAASPTSRPRAR